MSVFAVSCRTTKLVSKDYERTISTDTSYTKRKVVFQVPERTIALDGSLAKNIHFIHLNDTVTVPCIEVDTNPRVIRTKDMSLQIKLDSLGNYVIESVSNKQLLEQEISERTIKIHELEKTVLRYEKRETWLAKTFKTIIYIICGLIALVGIAAVIIKNIRPKLFG